MAVRREPRVSPERWSRARRVLVVRPDGLGDVLMTAPAIAALRAAGPPDRHVTLLAAPDAAGLADLLPAIDDAFGWRVPWTAMDDAPDGGANLGDDLRLLSRLSVGRYDAALICTTATQSALPAATLCRLAGIPLRAAFARENPYGLLTDWIPEPEPNGPARHEVRRQLDLARHLGADAGDASVVVRIPEGAVERARRTLERAGVRSDGRWFVLHPGAAAASRRYPPASYARAADALADEGWHVVVTGTSADRDAVDATLAAMIRRDRAVDLTDAFDLVAFAALLRMAPVVVANNTGPAHLAAAVGTPVVDLYALTNPQHAPWGAPHRLLSVDVPCRNCYRSVCVEGHHRCLTGVEPHAVVAAVHALLADPSAASATSIGAPA